MPRIGALLALVGALGCGPRPSGPTTDSCATPSSGSVDSVELGAASAADLNGGSSSPFTLLHDGDGMTLVHGGQGATMLGFTLRVTGASAPSCLGQKTTVNDADGAFVTQSTAPLTTYAQPDGSRTTHPVWMPAEYPATFVVTTAATGQSVTVHLHLLLAQ